MGPLRARRGVRAATDLESSLAGAPRALRGLVPIVLGAGMGLAHEPWLGPWPVFVGFALALLTLPRSPRAAAWHMWLLGLGYFGVTLRWIIEPFLVDIARHGWMAPFAIILMAGGLALFWGLAGGLARWIAGPHPRGILWAAFMITALELVRGHVFTGFPWGLPSYALVGTVLDVWLAYLGPYGVTGLIAAVAGMTAYGLHRGRVWVWPALVGVGIATLGVQAITPDAPEPHDTTVRVIQPNAPQHLKWDRDWMGVFFQRALDQTAAPTPADVVIWPETSVPSLLNVAGPLLVQMSQAAGGASVVAGIQREAAGAYHNSAVVLEGPTTVADIYDKTHLVPFGEYVPLAALLRPLGLGTLVDQVAGFTPGARAGVVDVDGLGRVRVLICYEGIFPEEIATGSDRPDVLLILTNDAWFGQGPGPRQHLVQAQARAIEQGLPVIRSANTGISAVIDARGRIVDQVPLNVAAHLDAAVPGVLPPTLYSGIGDWPLAVLLALVTCVGIARRPRVAVDGAQSAA